MITKTKTTIRMANAFVFVKTFSLLIGLVLDIAV